MMRSVAIVLLVLGAGSQNASAQPSAADRLAEGRRLFEQSCGVCHTKPTLASGLYGPALSGETMGGRADVMRDVIRNGTPRMPGFKHNFTPDQIDAIVAYLKTLPPTANR